MNINLPTWLDILGLVGLVGTAVITLRSTALRQNVNAQKGLIDTLTSEVATLKEQQKVSDQHIKNMQGELEVVKGLPLKILAETQAAIAQSQTELSNTQSSMFNVLKDIQKEIKGLKNDGIRRAAAA